MAAIGDIVRFSGKALNGKGKAPAQQVINESLRKSQIQERMAANKIRLQEKAQKRLTERKDGIRNRLNAPDRPRSGYGQFNKRQEQLVERGRTAGDLKWREQRKTMLKNNRDGTYSKFDDHTLDGKGSFMGDADWDRLKASRSQREASAMGRVNRETSPLRKSRRAAVKQGKADRKAGVKRQVKQQADDTSLMGQLKSGNGIIGDSMATAGTMFRSASRNLAEEGNLGRAFRGTVQSTAVSAGAHAGLAALQGEDPWEAAKTGAIRGAFAGAGYQGLKAATHTNAGSIGKNMKGIARTSRDTYKAHTAAGNEYFKQNPKKVTNTLRRVLENKAGDAQVRAQSKLK